MTKSPGILSARDPFRHRTVAAVAAGLAFLSAFCRAGLIESAGPAQGAKQAYESLGRAENLSSFKGYSRQDLSLAPPHRVYYVRLSDVAAGRLLSAAGRGSWMYLVMAGPRALGGVQLDESNKEEPDIVFEGGLAPSILAALDKANGQPQVMRKDYEVRFLSVPGANYFALWLHAQDDDLLLPIPMPWRELDSCELSSERDVLDQLRPEAERTMAAEKSWGP